MDGGLRRLLFSLCLCFSLMHSTRLTVRHFPPHCTNLTRCGVETQSGNRTDKTLSVVCFNDTCLYDSSASLLSSDTSVSGSANTAAVFYTRTLRKFLLCHYPRREKTRQHFFWHALIIPIASNLPQIGRKTSGPRVNTHSLIFYWFAR